MRRHLVLFGFLTVIILVTGGMGTPNGEGLMDESTFFDSMELYDMFEMADSPPGPEGPVPLWNYSYGGTGSEIPYSIIEVSSGGYVVTGKTDSYGAGLTDMWLARIDSSGTMLWNRTFGYSEDDAGYDVLELADGGFIIAGYTFDPVLWIYDLWLVRTDADGNHEWNVTHGYTSDEKGVTIVELDDGSFTIAGTSTAWGSRSIYLLHTDENGIKIWDNGFTLGVSYILDMIEVNDGGYIIVGYESYGPGQSNMVIVKANAAGQVLWEQSLGGLGRERAYALCETETGNIFVTGITEFQGVNDWDVFVTLLDEQGHNIWTQTYGGVGRDYGIDIIVNENDEVVVCGHTDSYGAGNDDVWLFGLDQSGSLLWNYTFGTSGIERGECFVEVSGGGYTIAGRQGATPTDLWLLRLPLLKWNETPSNQVLEFLIPMNYNLNTTSSVGIQGWGLNDTVNFNIDGNGIISNITTLTVGEYGVQVWVNDTLGGLLIEEFTVRVQDTTPPQWEQAPVDQLLEVGENLQYDLNASDETGLTTWRLNVTTAFSINIEGVVTTELQLPVGLYPIEVSVCDSHGNWLYGTFVAIFQDTTAPEWVIVPENQILEYGEDLNYRLYTSDLSGIGSWAVNDTGNFAISSTGQLTSIVTLDLGIHWLQIRVNDTYNNQRTDIISVIVTSEDHMSPTWDQALEDQHIECGEHFRYDVNASDPSSIHMWMVLDARYFTIDTNGVIENSTSLIVGVYVVFVSVNDTMGNTLTGFYTLFVHDTTPPEWVEIPMDQVLEYGESFAYLLQATDLSGIGSWNINDTANFEIIDGLISNITSLQPSNYGISVSVGDIYANIHTLTFRVIVNPPISTTTTTTTTTSTTTTSGTTTETEPDLGLEVVLIIAGATVSVLMVIIVFLKRRSR